MTKSFKMANIICVIVLCLLIILGIHLHTKHQIQTTQAVISNDQHQISYYRGQRQRLALTKVKKKSIVIEHKVPNLLALQSSTNKSINKGLQLAFNDCHTQQQFDHNRISIDNNLGSIVGGKVQTIVRPIKSPAIGQPMSPSNHLIWTKIGYGPIDSKSQIPVTVVLMYQSPTTYAKTSNGTTDSVASHTKGSHKVSSKSKVVLDLNLNVHSKQLTYNQGFQVGANDEQ